MLWLLIIALCTPVSSGCPVPADTTDPTLIGLCSLYDSANGANWVWPSRNCKHWDTTDYCSWCGVHCDVAFPGVPVQSGVTLLDLNGYNLTGTVPSNLNKLTNLSSLNLGSNHLTGSFPFSPGDFELLTSLNLSNNHFNIELPPNMFLKMPYLRFIYLYSNSFPGRFPLPPAQCSIVLLDIRNNRFESFPATFPSSCPLLRQAIFDGNRFGAELSLQEFCSAPLLTTFSCANCQLQTLLPNCVPPSLLQLFLQNNEIAGSIPEEFFTSNTLTQLDLSFNRLSGVLPRMDRSQLIALDVSSNFLTGTLTSLFPKKLIDARFRNNLFYGDVPTNLCPETLVFLDVSMNLFNGSIPRPTSTLLGVLDFSSNPHLLLTFPSWLQLNYQSLYPSPHGHFLCPSLTSDVTSLVIISDPQIYRYDYCFCEEGYFPAVPLSSLTACSLCSPFGVNCTVENYSSILSAPDNFRFEFSGDNLTFVGECAQYENASPEPCLSPCIAYRTNDQTLEIRCQGELISHPNDFCSEPYANPPSCAVCSCSLCAEGYFGSRFTGCQRCDDSTILTIAIGCTVGLILVGAFLLWILLGFKWPSFRPIAWEVLLGLFFLVTGTQEVSEISLALLFVSGPIIRRIWILASSRCQEEQAENNNGEHAFHVLLEFIWFPFLVPSIFALFCTDGYSTLFPYLSCTADRYFSFIGILIGSLSLLASLLCKERLTSEAEENSNERKPSWITWPGWETSLKEFRRCAVPLIYFPLYNWYPEAIAPTFVFLSILLMLVLVKSDYMHEREDGENQGDHLLLSQADEQDARNRPAIPWTRFLFLVNMGALPIFLAFPTEGELGQYGRLSFVGLLFLFYLGACFAVPHNEMHHLFAEMVKNFLQPVLLFYPGLLPIPEGCEFNLKQWWLSCAFHLPPSLYFAFASWLVPTLMAILVFLLQWSLQKSGQFCRVDAVGEENPQ